MPEESSSLVIVEENDIVEKAALVLVNDAAEIIGQKCKVFCKTLEKFNFENGGSLLETDSREVEHEGKSEKVKEPTGSVDLEPTVNGEANFLHVNEKFDSEKSALEGEVDEDIVMIDGCDDHDERTTHGSQMSSKNQKIYKRKVVRIPKEVFDYMARVEENGVVRLNVTQLSVFFTNELARKSIYVDATTWDTSDEVPVLDISVPPTAKLDPTLIVNNFDNHPIHREAQETRLKSILEHRQSQAPQNALAKKLSLQSHQTTISKILPAEQQVYKRLTKKQRWREKIEEKRNEGIGERNENREGKIETIKEKPLSILELRQKRLAEHNALSVVQESGTTAKKLRLCTDCPTSPKLAKEKTHPKYDDGLPLDTGGGGDQSKRFHEKTPSMSSSNTFSHAFVFPKGEKDWKQTNSHRPRFSPMSASNSSREVTEWRFAPLYYQNGGRNKHQRYRSARRTQEQLHYAEIHAISRGVSAEVSPWSRPPVRSLELHKLEQVMRKAVQNNASSIDAARQVEKLGLGPAMGTLLSAVNHSDLPPTSRGHCFDSSSSLPVRSIAPLFDSSLNSNHKDSFAKSKIGGRGFNSSVINNSQSETRTRDINTFAKPLGEFSESSTKFSRVERISYPLMSSSGGISGSPTITPFGQSYSASSNQTYGQSLQYGRTCDNSTRRGSPYNIRRCYR